MYSSMTKVLVVKGIQAESKVESAWRKSAKCAWQLTAKPTGIASDGRNIAVRNIPVMIGRRGYILQEGYSGDE